MEQEQAKAISLHWTILWYLAQLIRKWGFLLNFSKQSRLIKPSPMPMSLWSLREVRLPRETQVQKAEGQTSTPSKAEASLLRTSTLYSRYINSSHSSRPRWLSTALAIRIQSLMVPQPSMASCHPLVKQHPCLSQALELIQLSVISKAILPWLVVVELTTQSSFLIT